jgi:16S rRNA (uracil1498-N3)-methyltransferase
VTDPAARATLRAAAAHVLVADVGQPVLDDATSHHLFRVLRVHDGDAVTVTDGQGNWRACRASGGGVLPDAEASCIPRAATATVAFAIPKADRPEWIVQKLTEMGVARIVLLHAERSVVRWESERAERHLHKLRRVAVEALEQSRGVWLPEITGPVAALEVLPTLAVAEPGGRNLSRDDNALAVGPEGGWSPAELAVAAERIALTATVLRVETAALVAGAMLTTRLTCD